MPLALAYSAPDPIDPVDPSVVSNIEDRLLYFLALSPVHQMVMRRQIAADIVGAVLVLSKPPLAAPTALASPESAARREVLPSVPNGGDSGRSLPDIDAVVPQFCLWCSCREVDPDEAPYCSKICAISAEND
jgi:hypothetical protein